MNVCTDCEDETRGAEICLITKLAGSISRGARKATAVQTFTLACFGMVRPHKPTHRVISCTAHVTVPA